MRIVSTGKNQLTAYAVAVVGSLLIFGSLAWDLWQYSQPAPLGGDRVAVRRKALAELRATEAEMLNRYAWQDQAKGIVRLPIAEAMKLAERQWQNPTAARSNLIVRVEKATAVPPRPPGKSSRYE
jgi:hypothetical protein